MEYFCANISLSGHWPRTRCRFKIFCFLALAAILFNGAAPRWPSWIFDPHNFSLFRSRSHPVAKEQVSAQSDLRFEKRCRKLIFKMAAVVAILFVCVEVLRPSQPNGVMSSAVSLLNHTFTGQAYSSKRLTSIVHIL